MKHHLRSEKNCLNCGAEVTGRYCGNCGQENTEPKETFGHLIRHFFEDVTHFDSQLFTTVKDLLFRPGFLTGEYFAGRRTSYLNPIRMYVFISFIFFLVLFLNKGNNETAEDGSTYKVHYTNAARQHIADSLRSTIIPHSGRPGDSIKNVVTKAIAASLDTIAVPPKDDESITLFIGNKGVHFEFQQTRYKTLGEYDSVQQSMPEGKKDKGIMPWMVRRTIDLKNNYGNRGALVLDENFEHSLPKIMFVLLPLFALLTGLFYSRKKYYYAQHVIFSVHFHCFMFLVFILITGINRIFPKIDDLVFLILPALIVIYTYLSVALKNMYHNSLIISFIKAAGIGLLYIISLVICIIALAFASFFLA